MYDSNPFSLLINYPMALCWCRALGYILQRLSLVKEDKPLGRDCLVWVSSGPDGPCTVEADAAPRGKI